MHFEWVDYGIEGINEFEVLVVDENDKWLLEFDESKYGYPDGPEDTFTLRKEMREWCRRKRMRPKVVQDIEGNMYLRFFKKEQLILFKMRWS